MKKLLYLLLVFPLVTYSQRQIIHAGNLIDGYSDELQKEKSIVIENGKITSIQNGFITANKGETVIDLKNMTVSPGLIDMHVHIEGETSPDRYIKSMRYELSIFTKFLTEEIEENSIVVLLGDHQPPWIANEGSEVPLHIISKHKAYLKHLNSIGFQKGMEVKDFDRVIHHKDIYQILVKMLNTQ